MIDDPLSAVLPRLLRSTAARVAAVTLTAAVPVAFSLRAYAPSNAVLCDAGAAGAASAPASPLSPDEFRPFKLVSTTQVSANTRKLRFEIEGGGALGIKTASALLARTTINGEEVIRPYTPVTLGDTQGYFELVVKGYPEGKLSKVAVNMQPGQTMDFKGPIQKIVYTPNMKKQLGFVVGGTGITPAYQVIQEVLRNPADQTKLSVIFGNVSPDDILLKAELDALAAAHPDRLSVTYIVDKPAPGWTGPTGYVTKELVAAHMPAPGSDGIVMVCGPPPMMKAISGPKAKDFSQGELTGMLAELGYSPDNVYKF